MTSTSTRKVRTSSRGVTLFELLIVMGIIAVMSAIALPGLLGSSRAIGSAAMPRELVSYLRLARQEAMSKMLVFTCSYDNLTKQITITNHGERGITYDPATDTMVKLPGNAAPSANVVADVNVEQVSLTKSGIPASAISFGRVDGYPATTVLDDGVAMATMPAGNKINFTFQPDGSVVNAQNNPISRSLFLYNQQIGSKSAFAITVLGTTGRIKLWRYASNVNRYSE